MSTRSNGTIFATTRKEEMKAKTKGWLFVLAVVAAILIACVIQIRGVNPFH
jgi:hypothetical protein